MKNIFTLSVFLIAVLYSSAQFSLSNKAVHFSNTNNSVNDEGINIPSNSLMDFTATQSFTIEAWIKPTQATGCGMIFVEEYCPGPSTGVRLNLFGEIGRAHV